MSTATMPTQRAVHFTMPTVELGQTVYWYATTNKDERPIALIVTSIGDRTIEGGLLRPNITNNVQKKDSLKHIDDPHKTDYDYTCGFWKHTPRNEQIDQLLREFNIKAEAAKTLRK